MLLVDWCVAHHLIKFSNVVRDRSASSVGATSHFAVDSWEILWGQCLHFG